MDSVDRSVIHQSCVKQPGLLASYAFSSTKFIDTTGTSLLQQPIILMRDVAMATRQCPSTATFLGAGAPSGSHGMVMVVSRAPVGHKNIVNAKCQRASGFSAVASQVSLQQETK